MHEHGDTSLPSGWLYGVSLGPGDPGLLTLKAFETLTEADVIYCPATRGPDGAVTSVACDILRALVLPAEKFRLMAVPMSHRRAAAEASYEESWKAVAADCRAGRKVAVTTVGDAGFYSTLTSILEMARRDGIAFSVVPGVPAFLAAGAAARIPLALRDERVEVVSRIGSDHELDRLLGGGNTVVVMKLSMVRDRLLSWLEKSSAAFVYAEKIGMEGEFVTSDIEELRSRNIPYLSLLICSRHCPQPLQN